MKIIYHSLTGNIKRFLSKSKYNNQSFELLTGEEIIDEKFILITYTIGNGEIPQIVEKFMRKNYYNCKGLIGSGNRNWGKNFCKSVYKLNDTYNIPVLLTFETSGTKKDIIKFHEIIKEKVNEL